ncbi:MAG: hypothetical protein ACK559_40215, partial [bacterium]
MLRPAVRLTEIDPRELVREAPVETIGPDAAAGLARRRRCIGHHATGGQDHDSPVRAIAHRAR